MMEGYVKRTEGRRTYFIIPVVEFEQNTAYLDLTDRARNAINRDRRRHYESENGPEFAIEVSRALEYAKYVREYATETNLHKFNTRDGYTFFTIPKD